jgi:hypothetical protein
VVELVALPLLEQIILELQVVPQLFQQSHQLVVAEVEHIMQQGLMEDLVVVAEELEILGAQLADELEEQEIRPL